MVSFRYHVVTIVAVFLALGLGILMGTTVIKQSVVDELQTRANNAFRASEQLRKDVADLRRQIRTWEAFAPQAQRVMVDRKLTGRTVVILTADGVDFGEIDGVRKALNDADATVSGVLVMSSRMRLEDDESRRRLAGALGLPDATDPAVLAQQGAEAIAVRLSQGAPVGLGTTDLLDSLAKAQLLSVREPANGLQNIGGPGQAVVLLTGGTGQPAADPQTFFVPLLQSLVQSGQATAAGETSQSAYDVIGPIRSDGILDGAMVTVDNADEMMGRAALILGIQQMLDSGITGCADFGLKAGACALIPVPTPSP
jgi:copper transport outer membrane protein MctB